MTNHEVATTFRRLADLLSIRGESVYKVAAYRRAADSIDLLAEPLEAVRQHGGLEDIPGVGKEIAQKISGLLDTGTFPLLQEVEAEFPPGVAELLTVPGIGPKRARELYQELGIDSLDALRNAVAGGRLDHARSLGPGIVQRIAEGLRSTEVADQRLPLGVAHARGLELIRQLLAHTPQIRRVELAGSIRRFRETIGDLDIAAAADDPSAIVEAFVALPTVAAVERQGQNRCRVLLQDGVSADLWVLPERHWGSLLHHVTGTREHNIRLRDLARERGAHLSEYGYTVGERLIPCATEDEVYRFLDMQYVPPTMRQNIGEIELARKHTLPEVIGFDQLRGDLHAHSDWSDGTRSIREMAVAARGRGYKYLCITDHSRGLAVAHGLDAERLRSQRAEIDRLNAELAPFRVLQGIELEVRADGSLDLDNAVLATLEIVVAAVHSGLRQDRATLTQRAVSAIRHRLVDVLAHPTGRILGRRPGGDFDLDTLYAEAARTGTVLEIDGDPARLDLRDVQARAAIAAGCTLSIDSDAHSIEGLGNVHYGIGTGQRAWVPPQRVLNVLPLEAMLGRLKRNRGGKQSHGGSP